MSSLLPLTRPQIFRNAQRTVSKPASSSPWSLLPSNLHPRPAIFHSSINAPSAPRTYSSSIPSHASDISRADVPELKLSPKWLSETKARLGKCIMFGMNKEQVERAGAIMKVLAKDWRELSAGSEGFLTKKGREGLCGQRVVWGEMDSMGHVNNVTYVRYAESARINWAYNFAMHIDPANQEAWSAMWTPKTEGLILRSIKTDYKFPMTYPDKVSVYHKLRNAPDYETDSFILDVIILSEKHQRPAARCTEDIVMYDYKGAKKMSIRPFMAKAFMETFKLQEEAKQINTKRVLAILKDVEKLEKETWDRSDAKEDFGSAT